MQLKFEVTEWLDPAVSCEIKNIVKKKILSETKERLVCNVNSPIDYGYSFSGLDPIKQQFLQVIRNFYRTQGRRPIIADIGAGFGSMTWKILAAGGNVDAFEIQAPSALVLKERIDATNPILWNGENIEDILHVYVGDALNVLSNPGFAEKYDFIWISQVLHFLTPGQMEYLRTLFQYTLKPNGEVFIETNTFVSFCPIDNYSILETTYQRAKQKGLVYPGFVAFNTATVIDQTTDRVVGITFINAYEQTEMDKYRISYQTNGYGAGYLGPSSDELISKKLKTYAQEYPTHSCIINRFHQVMNLLDEGSLNYAFGQHGFHMTISYLDPISDQQLLVPEDLSKSYNLAAVLKKSMESPRPVNPASVRCTVFYRPQHNQLISEIEKNCNDKSKVKSFLDALYAKNYSLALRRACSVGLLDCIKTLFASQISQEIEINQTSGNGFTALDWINEAKVTETIKKQIVTLLEERGAVVGSMLHP